ncbi:MAG: T9SS type A sorting domain-containing protein [Bacteroidales bacterium]|nr:T9SS type A sorting domain-containing protein [Bacteroidales bacterium]
MLIAVLLAPVALFAQANNVVVIDTAITACDSITMPDGITYDSTGIYVSQKGDTVFILDLTIGHAVNHVNPTPITAGCSYVWGDTTVYTTGTYTQTFTSTTGCDSIVTQIINIDTVQYRTIDSVACGSLNFYDSLYTVSGTYQHRALVNDCPNVITLNLTVRNPEQKVGYRNYTSCDRFTEEIFRAGNDRFYLRNIRESLDTNTDAFVNIAASHHNTGVTNVFRPRTMKACYDSTLHIHVTINKSFNEQMDVTHCGPVTLTIGEKEYDFYYTTRDTIRVDSTAKGCDSNVVVNIRVFEVPSVFIEGNTMLTPGQSTTLTATSPNSNISYKWAWAGETSNESSITLSNLQSNVDVALMGTSSVNGCTDTARVTVFCNVGIEDMEKHGLKIYPNPAANLVSIDGDHAMRSIAVYNVSGQQVAFINHPERHNVINVEEFSNGTYAVRILFADGTVSTSSMIVSK